MATTRAREHTPGEQVQDGAERAADSDAAEHAGRAGLVAQGALYLLMAALCVGVVAGHGDQGKVDQHGAIGSLAERPFGTALLVLLALGFAGYAAWRTLRAVTGRREGGSSRDGGKGALLRVADAGKAILYAALCASTIGVVVGSRSSSGSGGDARGWTEGLLGDPLGRIAVGLVGCVVVGAGAWLAVRGWKERFASRLELSGFAARHRRATLSLGRVGYVGRGAVFSVVGAFLVLAGAFQRADEPVGIDEALRRVVTEGVAGELLVLAASVGFAAFGLFSLVQARYRKVLDD